MRIINSRLEFETQGNADIIEISRQVGELVEATGLQAGLATVFVPGATGAVTTLEHEPGVCYDFKHLFDFVAPADRAYRHNERMVDSNGHSHVRAALLGPSLAVPFEKGKLLLGRWQQIVFVDFDEVARSRTLIVNIMGE